MATSAYWTWVNNGRRWQLAQPITDMVAVARRHGISVLGTIGNIDHLTAAFPEDHTPFSTTAWPAPATGWVCACDLANTSGLGAALLRDARAGRLPWLKYMNVAARHYEHTDGFQSSTWSGDEHVHLSCRSDWLTRSIGDYDPLAPPTPEDDMEPSTVLPGASEYNAAGTMTFGRTLDNVLTDVWHATHGLGQDTLAEVKQLTEAVAAIKADLAARPTPTIDTTALVEALRPVIGVAVAAELAQRLQE